MSRTVNVGTSKISITGDTDFSGQSFQIPDLNITVTDFFSQQNIIPAGLTDTYSAASFVNLSTTITLLVLRNYGTNTMTLTITHASGTDVYTIQADGLYIMTGALEGALSSVAVTGSEGDKYLLLISD